MWPVVLSIISVIISATALLLGIRNYYFTRYADVRKSQQQLRSDLKDRVNPPQKILQKALNQLSSSMPNDSIIDWLQTQRDYLRHEGSAYIAPSPQQLEFLITSIDAALVKLEEVRRPPTDDSIFLPDAQADARADISEALQKVQRQINCILRGIRELDKKALCRRRQVKLFRELER